MAELDALVEEVLLASRLDAGSELGSAARMDLLGLLAEEAARWRSRSSRMRVCRTLRCRAKSVWSAARCATLLENACRYGGPEATLSLRRRAAQ